MLTFAHIPTGTTINHGFDIDEVNAISSNQTSQPRRSEPTSKRAALHLNNGSGCPTFGVHLTAVLFGFDPETPRPRFADLQPAIFIDDVPKLRSAIKMARERAPYYVEVSRHAP